MTRFNIKEAVLGVSKTQYNFLLILPAVAILSGALCYVFVLLGIFNGASIAASIAASFLAGYLVTRRSTLKSKNPIEYIIFSAIALCFMSIWVVLNSSYLSENVFVNRDPAIYTVTATHLTSNPSLKITVGVADKLPIGVVDESSAFSKRDEGSKALNPQGAHLYSTMLAVAGRLGGQDKVLRAAPFFSALAMMSLFSLLNLAVRPRYAFAGTLAVGASLPFIYFSRDTYTEPLAMAITCSSLALFISGAQAKSRAVLLFSGVIAGAAFMNRADGLLAAAMMIVSIIVIFLYLEKRERDTFLRLSRYFVIGFAPVAFIALLGLYINSYGYFQSIRSEIEIQIVAIIALLGFYSALFAKKARWLCGEINQFIIRKTVRRTFLLLFAVLLAGIFSRHLWMVSRDLDIAVVIKNYVEGLQKFEEYAYVDGTRNYAEMTHLWLIWYMGSLFCAGAVAGLMVLASKVFWRRDVKTHGPLLVVFATISIVMMTFVVITPDHIWASRRFLPVVIPGMALFFAMALDSIYASIPYKKIIGAATAIFIAVSVYQIYSISEKFITTRTNEHQYGQVLALCENLDVDTRVLWLGGTSHNGLQTVRSFCGITEVYGYDNPTLDGVEFFISSANKENLKTVLVVTGFDYQKIDQQVLGAYGFREISRIEYEKVPGRLKGIPEETKQYTRSLLISTIGK